MRRLSPAVRGFTIVELLVVVTIIAVLVSILLPLTSTARRMANGYKCQSNVHALMGAFLAFAADHDSRLPGADRTPNPAPYQMNWLLNNGFGSAPQSGTIWPYVNERNVYLCPSLDSEAGLEYTSNGRFDYGFFTVFNGARLSSIPLISQVNLLNGGTGWAPTPIICQEDGWQINIYDIEGNHSNVDQMTHIHNGGCFYAAIDGSTNWVIEPDNEASWSNGCWQWYTKGPTSRQMRNLGGAAYGAWGSWEAD